MSASKKTKQSGEVQVSLKEILGDRVPDAIAVLVEIMQDGGQKPELRMKAAESILDRACGKASTTGSGDGAQSAPLSLRFEGVLDEWSK